MPVDTVDAERYEEHHREVVMGGVPLPRIAVAFAVVVVGVLASEAAAGTEDWLWLAVLCVGLVAGSTAGRPRDVWIVAVGVSVGDACGAALGLPALRGIFWPLLAVSHVLVVALAFIVGSAIGTGRPGLGRRWRIAVAGVVAVAVVLLTGWSAVLGVAYSETYITQEANARHDCRTPESRFSWTYEAVNYDRADDDRLLSTEPDPTSCRRQYVDAQAGPEVVSVDGTPIAGWYIPAGDAAVASTGQTLVLVHGGKSNKSGMLDYAESVHRDYNLLLVDLRNTGRSGGTLSSGGYWERFDVRAMIDWLDRTKHPGWLGLVANSNGAATGLAEAVDDLRIQALVLDSMHARIVTQLGNIAETELDPRLPAWPGALAVIAGASVRVGGDIQSVDPIRMLPRIGARPVLLTHGTADHVDSLNGALRPNVVAALGANVDLAVRVCPGADHGEVIIDCHAQWGEWVRAFLAEVRSRS